MAQKEKLLILKIEDIEFQIKLEELKAKLKDEKKDK
jgi:hypothetical protein